jgi:hypothetical protein
VLATLDLAHVRPFDAGDVSQRFLGDALVGSDLANGSSKRDGGFGFVGGGSGGSASLNRTLLHWQKRRTSPQY